MSYKHKPGFGTIFKLEDKKSENYPDYRGTIVLEDGKEKELALWVRDGAKGQYFSIKIQEPYKPAEPVTDDLPF